MNELAPLMAAVDIGDVIKLIVLLLIFVVPVVSQLIAKIRQIPPPDKRPLPPRPAQPDVIKEIEAFFGKDARRPPAKQPQRPKASTPAKKPTPAVPKPVEAATPAQPLGAKLEQHVSAYLDEKQFESREAALGKDVAKTDQDIQQRLHQVFDHQMSALEAAPGETAVDPASLFTTGLVDLLTNPESLRQAIILNEVLRRPEEQWLISQK